MTGLGVYKEQTLTFVRAFVLNGTCFSFWDVTFVEIEPQFDMIYHELTPKVSLLLKLTSKVS